MGDNLNQIRALLYKEYLVHKKTVVTTLLVEVGLPLFISFAFLVVFPSAIESRLDEFENQQAGQDRKQLNITEQIREFKDRFGANRTLFYAPIHTTSTNIMKNVDEILRRVNFSLTTVPFETVEKMEEKLNEIYARKGGDFFRRPIAAIVFRKLDEYPKNFSYVIRPTHFNAPNKLYINTEASSASFETGARELLPSDYVTSGFIYIQCLLNTAMLLDEWKSKLGQSGPLGLFPFGLDKSRYNDAVFPVAIPMHQADSSLLLDPILVTPDMLYSVSCMISFIPMLIFIKRILDEKSSKMTELLRLMSMKERNYWISKWLFYTAYFVVMNTVITVMLSFNAKNRINLSLYFAFNMLYSTSSMFLASALTGFFGKPITGIVAYLAYQVLNGRPLWRYLQKPGLPDARMFRGDIVLPDVAHIMLAIVLGPNYGAVLFLYMLYESAAYSHSATFVPRYSIYTTAWKNLFTIPPEYTCLSLGTLFVTLLLSALLWVVCLWLIRHVWPSEESSVKPFYFLLQAILRKFGTGNPVAVSPVREVCHNYFESDPPNLELGLFTNNVTKSFGDKVAVGNVTLRVYVGQITVLLGHNGAGKTTLIRMITGLIQPNQGKIYVGGVDVQNSKTAAQRRVGYCPQHTILYNTLTVEEHLWFFGSIKGFSRGWMPLEVNRVLNLLQLTEKRSTLANDLSGGMKKKLQIAIAIMGSSNILILDEPSSGLDIEARRMIWDILISLRKTYLILLTTHHMEEADCLGDRIAIMHEGHLRSCGSPMFLKHAFGVGYSMTVLKAKESTSIAEFLRKYINPLHVENETSNEIVFNVPQTEKKKLPFVLEELEKNLENIGAATFGLRSHSVDAVFQKATALFDDSKALNGSDLKCLYRGENYQGINFERFKALLQRRFYGWKRSKSVTFGFILMSVLSTMGSMLMLTSQLEKAPPTIEAWAQELNPRHVGYNVLKGFCTNSSVVDTFCAKYAQTATSNGFDVTVTREEPEDYTERLLKHNYERYFNETLIGGSLKNFSARQILWSQPESNGDKLSTNSEYEAMFQAFGASTSDIVRNFFDAPRFDMLPVAWYNSKAFHSPAISLNIMYTKLLRELVPNGSIELGIHTFPYENQNAALDKLQGIVFNTYVAIGILMLGFIFVVPYPSSYATKERISKAKYLMEMSGVKFWSYWSSNFLFDLTTMLIIFAPFWVIVSLSYIHFGRNVFFANWTLLSAFVLTFFGFILCSLVLTYVCSMIFTQASTVYAFIVIPSFITTAILNFVILILRMMPGADDGGYTWYQWFFIQLMEAFCHLCPLWLFTDVAVKVSRTTNSIYLCKKYSQDDLQAICDINMASARVCCPDSCGNECYNDTYNPFTFEDSGVLWNILLLFSMFAAYVLVLWSMENWRLKFSKPEPFSTDPPDDQLEDADVKIDRERIAEIIDHRRTTEKAFVAQDLTKVFKATLAVDHISFGVGKRECLGLLGFNGAGKTTTFRMIVGEIFATKGTSFVGSLSINRNFRQYVRQIGYCPQFDPRFHCLTGVEILRLFAAIRGIPKHDMKKAIDQMVCLVDLEKYANIVVDNYSGGNKRKLSLAIALIGTPSIVLLDEPSAGVDPVARRKLWTAIDIFRRTTHGCVIFSSHTMDECEALCDKLVIMKKGRFQCLGSPQYLKIKFSKGYTLLVKMAEEDTFRTFDRHLRGVFPSAVFKDMHQKEVTYYLTDTHASISHVFKQMENLESIFEIEDYTVSNTSLEDVFLSFNKAK